MTMTTSDAFARIESAAHESAFGLGKQPPTAAQCASSNYKVGRAQWAGLDLCIEQPRHSVREGANKAGKPWRSLMAAHYGYIAATKGADGDAVDCFIGPSVASTRIFVVNQGFDGKFDEHKVMLCFDRVEEAKSAYTSSYMRGWAGLQNIVECSLDQLKWWLKYGDTSTPMVAANLPHEGVPLNKAHWTEDALPVDTSLDVLIYDLRRHDGSDGLLLDAVTVTEIESDPENDSVLTLDGLTTPFQRVERTMSMLQKFMDRVEPDLTVLQMQVSSPFKRQGTVNVAVVYELSDGQTISVYLHNPDTTPSKLAPLDELISWKWLLNKKDVTIVVAPEHGVDLNVREVARRLMRVAKKNTAAFARANARRSDEMQAIAALNTEVADLENKLVKAQSDLEVAKLVAEERAGTKTPDAKPPVGPVEPEPAPAPDLYLPDGWSESTSGGMATKAGDDGGIVDIAPAVGTWFVIFNRDGMPQAEGFPTRRAAFEHFEAAIAAQATTQEPTIQELQQQLDARAQAIGEALKGWGFEWLGAVRMNGEVRVAHAAGGELEAFSRYTVRGPSAKDGIDVADDLAAPVSATIQALADVVNKAGVPVVVQTFQEWIATIPEGPATVDAMSLAAGEHQAQILWHVPNQRPTLDSACGLELDGAFDHAIASLAITAQMAANNAPIHAAEGNAEQAQLSADVAESARKAQELLATFDADSVALLASIKLDAAGNPADVCGSVIYKNQLVGLIEIDATGMAMVYRGNSVATPLLNMRTRLEAAGRAVHMLMEAVKAEEAGPVTPEPAPPAAQGPVFAIGDFLKAQFSNLNKLSTLAEYMQVGRVRTSQLVKVEATLSLTDEQFDEFAEDLMASHSGLGKGGSGTDSPLITQADMERGLRQLTPEQTAEWNRTGYRLGTVVMAPNRETIVVDAQGYGYARYVGINPEATSAPAIGEAQEPGKAKRATKKEVRDLYDSIAWSINDLQGHTPSEILRANTKNLTDKMEQAKAMLERGMPKDMGGVPDLASSIQRGQEMVDYIAKAQADRAAALEVLVNVANGSTPAGQADIDQLIDIGKKYAGDPDIQSLLGQAVVVIQAYEMATTNNI